ncbi:glycosyltransferase family 2 protein [Aestuariibius sp. HNIBRBA575]|uniref:glycosyltransferase family 2 protein n=1 Tax=Aestuariibius sp. HNIBRBA575 TaxID=3233343 RepID=UPI0034A5413D
MGRSRLVDAYDMRLRRRRLLWRSFRSRHALTPVQQRTKLIGKNDLLLFSTMRNEAARLPFFLSHYRKLGIRHFLIVDNASDDGTTEYLTQQPDVSVWTTNASYRDSRFGVDWLTWLQMRYGARHWCLTADADEILIYPHMDDRPLDVLTRWLDQRGAPSFGAMMLDMYPQGPLGTAPYHPGQDPAEVLNWFDVDNYTWEMLPKYRNVSIRGGVRKRLFFQDKPGHAPHLHKVPLVRWNRRFAYVSSTHTALPRRLNAAFDDRRHLPTGVFLHSKFLDGIIQKSDEEKRRRQHFTHAERYDDYYDRIIANPTLWYENSVRYQGWEQLEELGLMTRGAWR